MAVPKSRCSRRRQGNRESCKSLARTRNANNLKAVVKVSKPDDSMSFSQQFAFERGHQINSVGEYKGVKYRERKVKKKVEDQV